MAKHLSIPAVVNFRTSTTRHVVCQCAYLHSLSPRTLTTSPARRERQDTSQLYGNQGRELREGPRWASTPPRMMAPVRSKPPVPNNDFRANTDPLKLDSVYNNFFGRGGDRMLTEEVKWLAVTHKSFDHGRRGFNDRLSFLGMASPPLDFFWVRYKASLTEQWVTRQENC